MHDSDAPLQIALRILDALSEHVRPSPSDIAELRTLAPDLACHLDDELACEVVRRALRRGQWRRRAGPEILPVPDPKRRLA